MKKERGSREKVTFKSKLQSSDIAWGLIKYGIKDSHKH